MTPKSAASEYFAQLLMDLKPRLIRQTMARYSCHESVADEALMRVAFSFLRDLDRYDTDGLSDDFMTWPLVQQNWSAPYITRSVYHAAYHIVTDSHERPTAPEDLANLAPEGFQSDSEEVDWNLDESQRTRAIRTALGALVDRGQTRRRGTFISPAQFESYREALAQEDSQADRESDKQADQRRAQNMVRLRAALVRTRYVVGVLGGRGWLLSPKRINDTLDILDRSGPEPNKVLRDASTYVTTLEREGTRVMKADYVAAHDQDASATLLHRYEAELITDVGSTEPNCVLICEKHTVDPQRVTEY